MIVRIRVGPPGLTVDIFPLDLAGGGGRNAGLPILAGKVRANEMLARLRTLSAPYRTSIAVVPNGRSVAGRIVVALRTEGRR